MKKYLILDTKWSKHYGKNIYWKSNSDGYTEFISDAGIYDKKDMKCNDVKFVLITREVLDNAIKELKDIERDIKKEIKQLEKHKRTNGEKIDTLIRLSQELGVEQDN